MSDSDRDHPGAVAQYLATGDDPGLPGRDRDQIDQTRRRLRDPAMWSNPPPELADVIVARIDAAALGAVGEPEPRRRRGAWATLAGLAATLLVVAGLLGRDRLQTTPEDEGRQVALVGTDLAPDATGQAQLRDTASGVSLSVQIDGLGPAPAGSYYQAWVVGPRGTVPIGTFHLRPGTGHDDRGREGEAIELWAGVDLAEYPTLTVTIEPEDGDPASSGQRVLTAPLD